MRNTPTTCSRLWECLSRLDRVGCPRARHGRAERRRALGPARRLVDLRDERGDVPGWVLVTLMTAGLVVALWAVASPALTQVFNDAIAKVTGAM